MANGKFIFLVRCVLSLIWLHNGYWEKVVNADPHSNFVKALGHIFPQQAPITSMHVLGWTETLFAVIIVSGIFHRFFSWVQVLILLFVGLIGILTNSVRNPEYLAIMNLPLLMCMLLVAFYGPGSFALQINKRKG